MPDIIIAIVIIFIIDVIVVSLLLLNWRVVFGYTVQTGFRKKTFDSCCSCALHNARPT